jgi:RHS repeat-associated protein
LLTGVTTPFGGSVSIEYTPSTRFAHFGDDGAPDLPQVLQLVTAIDTADGFSTPSRVTMSYEGGLFDAAERELRGFRRVTATLADGRRTVTTFHQDVARVGLVESTLRLDVAGVAWEELHREYTVDAEGVAPWTSLVAAVTRVERGPGASPRFTRSEIRYDGGGLVSFGNATSIVEYGAVSPAGADLDPSDNRTTELGYARANTDLHLVDRVKRKRVLQGTGANALLLRETELFYDGDTSGASAPTRGLVTLQRDLLLEPGQPDAETRFSWDVYGNLVAEVDPRGNAGQGGGTTRFEWDAQYHALETAAVNALGHRSELSYTADASCPVAYPRGAGLVQMERGPNDLATGSRGVRCHDVFGRVVRERGPLGASETTWSYVDTPGAVSVLRAERATAAGGLRTTRSLLDGFGREIRTEATGPQGRTVVVERSFDAFGRVSNETAPRFAGEPALTTAFGYDPLDRTTLVRLPGSRIATTEYAPGRATLVDPTGRSVVRRLDAFDRVIEVEETEAANRYVTRYAWSATGELLRVTDARGNATQIVWDRLGRRRLLVDPDAGATAFTFDVGANVVRQDGPLGRIEWTWDALDRPTQRRVGGAIDATWTWDTALRGIGRVARRTDAAGVFEAFVYHPSGRPFSEAYTRGGVSLRFVTFYDPLGQPATRTYPSDRTVEWVHDSAGYVTQVRETARTYATGIEWDARGRLARWTAGNGVSTQAAFDPLSGRLDTLELRGAGGAALERLRYGFDTADRVVAISDLDASGRSRTFSYDALGRLERATGPFGTDLAPGTLRYAYDPLGNLTCKDATGPVGCVGGRTMVYPGAGAPRPHAPTQVGGLATSYTAAGALSSLGARRYVYDGLGQLSAVFQDDDWVVTHKYDADGRRARVVAAESRRTTTLELVAKDFDWDRTRGLAHLHVFLGGAPIATQTDRLAAPAAALHLPHLRTDESLPRGLAIASAAAALALCAQLARLRRRGVPVARPAVAGGTTFAFVLLVAMPLYALPDGDVDGNGVLDAADALRAWEIARGARTPTSAELAHGDVAPLEAAPESPSRVNGGDVALLLRVLAGDDVDGDGLSPEEESALGASPFRADSDRDGLSDPDELAAGTDPANGDSDGDGLTDGAEAAGGSDPLEADTDGDGLADAGDPDPVSGVVHRHADAIGSALWVTGEGGVVLQRTLYRPWGESMAATHGGDSTPPVFGFTGQRALPSAGLYDYGARFYDPSLGRFLQPDPRIPDPSDPQSLNRYAYARNDPLRRTDPTGETAFFAALFGAVASALSGVAGPENAAGLSNLGIALGAFARGGLDAGATVTSDGRLSLEIAGILVPPSFDGWSRRPPQRDLPPMTVAELRFGDVLLTRDGGSAPGIATVRGMEGYGHGAFVLGVEGPFVRVGSSDNRGRYIAENDDPSVGGRVWDVFRTGEPLYRDPALARVAYYGRTGGLNGGLSQYGGNAGANVCTSFTAELYRRAGGNRLPLGTYGSFVTPGEIALGLGPPVGRVEVPQLTILRRRP